MSQQLTKSSTGLKPGPIRVKVLAPGFINHDLFDQNGFVQLSDGDTLGSLLKILKVPLPLRISHFLRVNYERVHLDTRLRDQDIVTFLFPLSGG